MPARQSAGPKPEWATADGDDRFGHWADLVVGGVTQRMRWIAPGTFIMGSLQAEKDAAIDTACLTGTIYPMLAGEVPHVVTLTHGFWMADSGCTQGLWQAVMGTVPADHHEGPEYPVTSVNWDDAMDFLERLNARIPGAGFVLPTEAQREFACRAGSQGPFAGPDLAALCWFDGNSAQVLHPVMRKAPNAWGLYDMHGNLFEWCSDWYGNYSVGAVTDPVGPSSGQDRVVRGGGWAFSATDARSAFRSSSKPENRNASIGFRFATLSSVPMDQTAAVRPAKLIDVAVADSATPFASARVDARPFVAQKPVPYFGKEVDGLSLALIADIRNRNRVRIVFRNSNDEIRCICLGLDLNGQPSCSTLSLTLDQETLLIKRDEMFISNQYRVGRLIDPGSHPGNFQPFIVTLLARSTFSFEVVIDPFASLGLGAMRDSATGDLRCALHYNGGWMHRGPANKPIERWDPLSSCIISIDGHVPDFTQIPTATGPSRDLPASPDGYWLQQ